MPTILTLFFILNLNALMAKDFSQMTVSEKLENKKYYYSALNEFFKETYNREIDKDAISRLENLLYYTGIELLEDYEPTLLEKYPTSSTHFILARREKKLGRTKNALRLFSRVHKDHRYFPEAMLLEAQIHGDAKDKENEFMAIQKCQESALSNEASAKGEKIKRYYRMVYEICLVNKARRLYGEGEYKGALEAYEKIPKESYKWPYLLLEKAWAYFHLGNYNRALGLLVTYKSPLLDTYFFPEAEYLAALSYFKLCLYDDSLIIVNQYYQIYRPRFSSLEGVLSRNKSSQDYFYNLMFRPGDELKKHEEFVRQIITRLKKQTRFSLDFNSIYKIDREIERISKNEKEIVRNKMLEHLTEVRENMVTKINYNAKTDIFNFLESVPFYSSELFKLNLEIISRKKDLVYKNNRLAADRARGDYAQVERSRFEQFWTFQGAFWADELGDYSLGLKSNCQTVRKDDKENSL